MNDRERNEIENRFEETYQELKELGAATKKWKFEIGEDSFNFEKSFDELCDYLSEVEEGLNSLESFEGLSLFQRAISGLDQESNDILEENQRLVEEIKEKNELILKLCECLEKNDQTEYRFVIKPDFEKGLL